MPRASGLSKEPRLCACGCGQLTPRVAKGTKFIKFVRGHRTPGPRPLCACGCGQLVGTRRGLHWPKWCKGHHVRRHGFDPVEAKANERLLRVYGISRATYESMVKLQCDKCAICGTAEKGRGRRMWCVDHSHETQEVRGLLCSACNSALGSFKDDPDLLNKAIAYILERS